MEQLKATVHQADGPFHDHLERLRFALSLDMELSEAVRGFLVEEKAPTSEQFLRLCAAGVMIGTAPNRMQRRCSLYEHYLRQVLL